MRSLRQQVLALTPDQIHVSPTPERPHVWGAMMETGFPDGMATFFSLADGTTSLYLSHGGGVIGAGEHDEVRREAEQWLATAEAILDQLSPAAEFSLPSVNEVAFHVLTFEGARSARAPEEDLGSGQHPLSRLFFAAHQVLTKVREISSTPRP